MDIEADRLTLQRRILVQTPLVVGTILDAYTPYFITVDTYPQDSAELAKFKAACTDRLSGDSVEMSTKQFSDFAVGGIWPHLKIMSSAADIMSVVGNYIWDLCTDDATPATSVPLLTSAGETTLNFESWMVAELEAKTATGTIAVRVNYPDVMFPVSNKPPIDDIDTFLAAATAWSITTYPYKAQGVMTAWRQWEGYETKTNDRPSRQLRTVSFDGELHFLPFGSKHDFSDSSVTVVADTNQLPSHNDLGAVLHHFRDKLVELAPELQKKP